MSTQSPPQEISERIAEAVPGLVIASYVDARNEHRANSAAHRARVADSHRWQAEALGMTASDVAEDDMGNTIITGDVYGANAAEIIRSLQGGQVAEPTPAATSPTPTIQPAASALSNLAKAGIVAAVLGSGGLGAAVPWLLGAYEKPAIEAPAPVVQPGVDTDTQYELRFVE